MHIHMINMAIRYPNVGWYESDAIKDSRNAGSAFAAMRVSEEDMKNLREHGFFDKDGYRYYNNNTLRRIS